MDSLLGFAAARAFFGQLLLGSINGGILCYAFSSAWR